MANATSVRDKRGAETTKPAKNAPATDAASVGGKRGIDLLHDPVLNKATAYTEAERQALGLVGLVPDATESEDLQLRRVLHQLGHKTTDLERYIYLISLLDNDEAVALLSTGSCSRSMPRLPPTESVVVTGFFPSEPVGFEARLPRAVVGLPMEWCSFLGVVPVGGSVIQLTAT